MTAFPDMTDLLAPSPALYTIPSTRPFLSDLAQGLMVAYRDDVSQLAQATIFLPNKRAARELASAFQQQAAEKGQPVVLLPRLRALGEIDEEDLLIAGAVPGMDAALPAAADRTERRLLLARLIKARHPDADWPSRFRAADELASLLDTFYLEGVSPEALQDLVADDVTEGAAQHWKEGLDFIRIVTENWPLIMGQLGQIDAVDRSARLMAAYAAEITEGGSAHPIIVAGSLGTVAATGALLKAVAETPNGMVILPGFDPSMDDKAWEAIDPPHPQALFRERLERDFPQATRQDVVIWPASQDTPDHAQARHHLLSLALRPAQATDDWYSSIAAMTEAELDTACQGLSIACGQTPNEEAAFIALAIREAMHTPEKTVMFVTPDRQLAQRVETKLKAWNIDADDTGGMPLNGTYRGTFMRLIAGWLDDPSSPRALMALLHHPLAAMGQSAADWGKITRALDVMLRGRRKTWRLADLTAWLDEARWPDRLAADKEATLTVMREFVLLSQAWASVSPVAEKIRQHIEIAERLTATDTAPPGERLWNFEDGEELAAQMSSFLQSPTLAEDVLAPDEAYAPVFDALMGRTVVRKLGGHPRIKIFGLLEARLQQADLVILGGLNEGVWPDIGDSDSFLSRPMRMKLGLPTVEHLIGRAAHDFVEASSHAEVLLTRSARRDGNPAAPSRWSVRLENVLTHRQKMEDVDKTAYFHRLSMQRHLPAQTKTLSPPQPRPAQVMRPRRFSVSDIEALIRDPYSIFAKKVLGLRVLEPLEAEPTIGDRGSFLHLCAELFVTQYPNQLPPSVDGVVSDVIKAGFAEGRYEPAMWLEWSKAREDFALFLAAFEAEIRQEAVFLGAEVEGEWSFDIDGDPVTLRGRADRVDLLNTGGLSIIDLKTSGDKVPTDAQQRTFSPQLMLLAMIAEAGGLGDLAPQSSGRLSFVKFAPPSKGTVFSTKSTVEAEQIAEAMPAAREQFFALMRNYLDPDTPYLSQPRPMFTNDYGDFDHLARRREWASEDGDD